MNRRGFFAGLGAAALVKWLEPNPAVPKLQSIWLSDEYHAPDEEMLAKFYDKWIERFQGPEECGRLVIVGPGVEVKSLEDRPKEMAYEPLWIPARPFPNRVALRRRRSR